MPHRNGRSPTLSHLILGLVVTLGCVNGVVCLAYFYYRFHGLPPFLQDSKPVTLLALWLSIGNIFSGICYTIAPFVSFLSKRLVRGNDLWGYGCLSLGAACILFLLNSRFAVSSAFIASLMAFAIASVLFGINTKMLAAQFRAARRLENKSGEIRGT